MSFITFILIISGGYVTVKLVKLIKENNQLVFLGLATASSIFVVIQFSFIVNGIVTGSNFSAIVQFIAEWGHIICLALVLSSLAIFIRESKPVFAQFPVFYAAVPLIVIVSFAFVRDNHALREWLLAIYQGGAIFVSLLMYSVYTYRKREYSLVLLGVSLIFLSYVLFWYVPSVKVYYSWIWKLLMITGMVTMVLGYQQVGTTGKSASTVQREIANS